MITYLLCAKKLAGNYQLCLEFQITRVLKKKKERILLKAFVESQFGYYPLTWMFYSRKANFKINHIHERSLRIVYKYNIFSFEELLKKNKSFCIHHRNIQSLAIELFKINNNLSNRIMCDIFETRNLDYNLRSQIDFIRTRVNTSSFGSSSLKYLASKVWDIVPYEISQLEI